MPSTKPILTQAALLQAFLDAIVGGRDGNADENRGSSLEGIGGASAILARRESQRDRGMFRAAYFDTATGDDLNAYALARFGETPIPASQGVGTVALSRVGVAAGTVYRGTRIRVFAGTSRVYETTADVAVAAGAIGVLVPVRAIDFGAGTSVHLVAPGPTVARIEDPLFDDFTIAAIDVADGLVAETPPEYRARNRAERRDARPGRALAVLNAANGAGATLVVAFESSAQGAALDSGIQAIYVGDASGNGSVDLVRAVTVALESARVLGAPCFVGPLVATALPLRATLELDDLPGNRDTLAITRVATGAVLAAFASQSTPYGYSLRGLEGAIVDASPEVRSVTWTAPTSEPSYSSLAWPASLPVWRVDPLTTFFDFVGPQ